ncbi:MFS transporter [Alicyclobacillus shizuokensis]|uniref:MFS transporter n=1 Tax=Alicyclobacillus shizuokensis TaxID=392014 RepID=UPI000833F774|nr:MFS transporter [Alicyclobacillus shizuokensis]
METWRRNLAVLWIGCLVTSASFSMVIPFLPLFLIQIGVHTHTEMWSGLLYSAAFVAGAIASPFWGSMADKYGRKPMIVRAGFALFAIYVLTAFTTNPYEVLALRILQGLLSGYIPGAIALVGTNTPENKVGYALSMISAASATGGIVGPLLGGGLSHLFSNRIAFASAGVMVFFSTFLVIFWVTEDKFEPTQQRTSVFASFRDAWHNKPLLSAFGLNAFTAFSIMTVEPVLTLYVAQLSGSVRNASLLSGVVFSLAGIASVVFAPLWGKLADRTTFRRVLLIGLIGGGLWTLAQIPFHQVWTFALVRFIYGAFFCAVFPAINGLVVRFTTPDFRGRAFGLNQTANQIGNTLGPLVGGWIGGAYSIHSLFWCTGGLLLMVAGMAWFATGRQTVKRVKKAHVGM